MNRTIVNHLRRAAWAGCLAILMGIEAAAQNVVDTAGRSRVAGPTNLVEAVVSNLVFGTIPNAPSERPSEAASVRRMLEAHLTEFLDGWPWRPFHHTLGISGYEVNFDHPDEMFHALALALPALPDALAGRTREFLAERLSDSPPYGVEGFDRRAGRVRESYDVPDKLRLPGRGRARSVFGVYAFWEYGQAASNSAAARVHWSAIRERVEPLLAESYPFDVRKTGSSRGESQRLNGDFAGLVGFARLARWNGDVESERRALARAREVLELRVNLERVNPEFVEKSGDATKGLHNFKLARYCDLTPELGAALRDWTDGLAAQRLRAFRRERNGWYLAFGDRMIGGENYTNPLHFPRSLFLGAAWVEGRSPADLRDWIDVPWCQGDWYFIEKCALSLR